LGREREARERGASERDRERERERERERTGSTRLSRYTPPHSGLYRGMRSRAGGDRMAVTRNIIRSAFSTACSVWGLGFRV